MKYKKSEWYKGLLECEEAYKDGMRQITFGEFDNYLWLDSDHGNCHIGIDINKNYDRACGYLDYIKYYKNKLNNIENNQ